MVVEGVDSYMLVGVSMTNAHLRFLVGTGFSREKLVLRSLQDHRKEQPLTRS